MDLLVSANYASSESDNDGQCDSNNESDVTAKGVITSSGRNKDSDCDSETKQNCRQSQPSSVSLGRNKTTDVNCGQDNGFVKKRKIDRISSTFERSVPHARGNWAGHIYAELDETCEGYLLLKNHARQHVLMFQNQLKNDSGKAKERSTVPKVFSHLGSKAANNLMAGESIAIADPSEEEIHISLSKLFFVQQHSIMQFEKLIRQQIERFASGIHHLLPLYVYFPLSYASTKVLYNEERTRSFLTIPVLAGETILIDLIRGAIDPALAQFQQMPYYEPPIIHVSIASVLGCHDCSPKAKFEEAKLEKFINSESSIMAERNTPRQSSAMGVEQSNETQDYDESDDKVVAISIASIVCSLGSLKRIKIPLVWKP